jgi:hypothetical protein
VDPGSLLTTWTARIAAALYLAALALMVTGPWHRFRAVYTIGLLLYLVHVGAAFTFFYQWSHAVALAETARQTRLLFGVDAAAGLYLNYAFTVLWSCDGLSAWVAPEHYRTRARAGNVALHAFLLFMVLNGTVVVWVMRAMRAG